jgi:hypothetical protein
MKETQAETVGASHDGPWTATALAERRAASLVSLRQEQRDGQLVSSVGLSFSTSSPGVTAWASSCERAQALASGTASLRPVAAIDVNPCWLS